MEHPINLHSDINAFRNAIQAASQELNILPVFIEKDYWISLVLKRLSESKYVESVVFKGGTSLSKGYGLIDRFSEDIDIAVVNTLGLTGNQLKKLMRTVEKEIARDLVEIEKEGITSKGSRFRKSVYEYSVIPQRANPAVSNTIIVELNSFANPYPYSKIPIHSLIGEYLQTTSKFDLIHKYELQAFQLNVLGKNRTLIEKLVSLIRFSFDKNPIESISGKIRHFYDLHFLYNDPECNQYVNSKEFKSDLNEILEHDKKAFDEPKGWYKKPLNASPLLKDFDGLWNTLKQVYTKELSMLAFTEIPNEKDIAANFKRLISNLER